MTALLELTDIRRSYPSGDGPVEVLKGISLRVEAGEMVAIVGASGSGKSTLMNILGCLDKPTSGTYRVAGTDVSTLDGDALAKLRREHFGFIFQRYHLLSHLSAAQNVEVPAVYAGVERKKRLARAQALLTRLGLAERVDYQPSQLSGGQQQRVALARMMIGEPEVILLDEPFSALDGYLKDILQRDMQNFLKDYKGDMIMVTHSRDEAYKFCSQLTLLNNGKDILTGETRDIFENPQYLEAARLTGCKNFSAVQKMGSHEVYALDWELMLRSEQEVTEDITHVGIRGHWMRPATKAGENTMEVQVEEYIENTFEHQYLFRNKGAAESGTLWWMCQKKNFQETAKDNIPKYLYFPPEHVMLLKK